MGMVLTAKGLGYLGPRGTFSHEAAIEYDKLLQYEYIEYSSFAHALTAVKSGEMHAAIVPIENSLEGAVNATLDALAKEDGLYIIDELILSVKLHLAAKKGTDIEQITCILSHPQPLGQARSYIDENLPGVQLLEERSTAKAAERVAHSSEPCAAIVSKAAAISYGLEIIKSNIQDQDNNHTRFVIVAGKPANRTGNDKTSIVFSTNNTPGSLYRVLDIFSLWDINMTRIESRPSKAMLGQYIFFIDIDGHEEDQDVHDALTMVKRKASWYRHLGSYPKRNKTESVVG